MRTIFFIPSLTWESGGLTTLYRMTKALHTEGKSVFVTALQQEIPGLQNILDHRIPFLPWGSLSLAPTDTYVVPESHPNALAPGLQALSNTIVYVQNWYYMLSALPKNVFWEQLPITYIAVSHPVAWFMENIVRVKAKAILPPVIDQVFFSQSIHRSKKRIRIAFMPRKNPALAQQIQDVTMALLGPSNSIPIDWVSLHKLSLQDVAKQMATCHIFLSTGFPEGFGLPSAEAMATGCIPVGFSGFGGWEYMRSSKDTVRLHPASLTLPYSLSPNGYYTADGDIISCATNLVDLLHAFQKDKGHITALQESCKKTALLFTEEAQKSRLKIIFP